MGSGRCVYCGRPAGTREHIIATRFIEVLAEDPRGLSIPVTLTVRLPDGRSRRVGGRRSRRGVPTLEFTTGVCSKCNNEWMNDLDSQAFPYVSEMIRGNSLTLDASAAQAVATWFMKVAVTARSSPHVEQPIMRGWTEWLYRKRSPVPGWTVWIGQFRGIAPFWYNPDDIHLEAEHATAVARAGDRISEHGVLATCVIGYLVLQVLGVDGVRAVTAEEPAMPLLWPPRRSPLAWPPTEFISDEGLPGWAARVVANGRRDLPTVSPPRQQP
jgi:hypothetical protein